MYINLIKTYNKSILLSLLFIYHSSISCSAADSSFYYHFNTDNGLPSNNVYSVIKDRLGYIWVATDNGIAKYNGYSFKKFTTNEGLPSNDIWKLQEDTEGRIWLLSNSSEIGYMKNDRYFPLRFKNPSFKIYPVGLAAYKHISILAHIKDGDLYITSVINNNLNSLKLKNIFQFYQKNIQSVIIADDNKLIFIFFDGTVINIDLLKPFSSINIKKWRSGETYKLVQNTHVLLSKNGQVYAFGFKDSIIKKLSLDSSYLFEQISLDKEEIITAYFKKNNFIAITNKKIYNLSKSGVSEELMAPLPTNTQVTFIGDFDNKWYCTSGDGIWIELKSPLMHNIKIIDEIKNAQIVGKFKDTTYWWDYKNNQLIELYKSNIVNKKNYRLGNIKQILSAPKGKRILTTNGFYRWEDGNIGENLFKNKPLYLQDNVRKKDYSNIKITPDSSIIYTKNFRYITNINDTTCIILSHNSVEVLLERDEEYIATTVLKDRLEGVVAIDNNIGIYLLYSSSSINIYSVKNKKITNINTSTLNKLGLSDIRNIEFIKAKMTIYALTKNHFLQINIGKPLPTIKKIKSILNLNTTFLTKYNNEPILIGEFGFAFMKSSKNNRFAIIPSYKKEPYYLIKNIHISESTHLFITDNKNNYYVDLNKFVSGDLKNRHSINVKFNIFPLHKNHLKNIDSITLNQSSSRLTIKPINYWGSETYQIFYNKNNTNWEIAYSDEFDLQGLTPGNFHTIKYFLQDDNWTTSVNTIHIAITPFWYQKKEWQILFIILGISFFAGSILFAISYTRKLSAKANEKRRLQTELELRAIHSQINPHFIFNALSTALYFISKQKTHQAYDHVNQFSKLLRNYLKSSRERFITLADEIEILTQYIELQKARFSSGFHYEINVAENIDTDHVLLPSLLLQPLVENAINHGLFNKGNNGILKITFFQGAAATELICIIDDNGIGRAQAKTLNKRYRKEKKSYGTLLTKELIDIFKRYEQMDIILKYTDKVSPLTGTTVTLTIKNIKIISANR